MKKKYICILIALAFGYISKSAHAQEYSSYISDDIYESIIESFAEEVEEEGASISILEDLNQLAENRLNINLATYNDLEPLFFLNNFQKENLLQYREKYGQIYSYFEIENIPGFNRDITSKLVPFTVLGESEKILHSSTLRQEINFRTNYTIEKSNGFIPDENGLTKYNGIQPALFVKYRANYGHQYQWGLTFENDSGESFLKNSNRQGFDYNSGFLCFEPNSFFNKIILGDYGIRMGQGLIQWTGYSSRKSIENTSIQYFGQGIRPYTSTTENAYLRGVASEMSFSKFNAVVFASTKKVDANQSNNDSVDFVSALQTSGYHRTTSEIEDENSLQIATSGISLQYKFNNLSLGINSIYNHFSLPLIPANKLYNLFKFNGQNNYNISADFHARTNQMSLFGETALSKSRGKAILIGFEAQPANQIQVSFLYRNIDADFHTVGGSALTEWQSVQNENGIYSSILLYPFPKFQFTTTTDLYQSKWIRYQSNSPVRGIECNNQLKYQPTKKITFLFRHKFEQQNEKETNVSIIKKDVIESTQRARIQIEYNTSDQLRIKARLELSKYCKQDSTYNGLLSFIEGNFNSSKSKVKISARIAWFNIDDYKSRIYTYEHDMPSLFFIPSFSGIGMRYYLISSYRLTKNCTFYAKIAQARFSNDVVAISIGENEITGNHKSNLKFQIKYRF